MPATSSLGGGVQSQGYSNLQNVGDEMADLKSFLAGLHQAPPHTKAASGAEEPAPVSVPNTTNLTPEGLMAYCQSRLNSLDSQMTTIFNSQQSNAKLTQDVDAIASLLNDAAPVDASSQSSDLNVTSTYTGTLAAYNQAIKDAKNAGNPQLAQQLQHDLNTFKSEVDPNATPKTINANDISSLQQNLKNYGNELNSDSELSMINLQSLMSQRETAVQLTTNLVQSLGQQSQDITKNVGA